MKISETWVEDIEHWGYATMLTFIKSMKGLDHSVTTQLIYFANVKPHEQ